MQRAHFNIEGLRAAACDVSPTVKLSKNCLMEQLRAVTYCCEGGKSHVVVFSTLTVHVFFHCEHMNHNVSITLGYCQGHHCHILFGLRLAPGVFGLTLYLSLFT